MQNMFTDLKKIRTMAPQVIIKKIVKKLYEKVYFYYLEEKLKNNPITLGDNFFNDFIPKCNFLYAIDNKNQYTDSLNTLTVETSIIEAANKICKHEFNLLGSGDKCLGKNISWNEDFKAGYRWENNFYKNIKIIDLTNDADVKVPWELSRFQHIFTLGKAYWLTDDENYAIEFKEEIAHWILSNPVEMSVNWTCTMDVSIRAINWICGYFFFKKSMSLDKNFWNKFNESIYLHGRFIYRNLENQGKHNGNHYLSDICGLIFIGIYFGDFFLEDKEKGNNPSDWLKFGLAEFENEMKKEVNRDGTDFEASTSYHKLVTEIFLFTTILCNKNNINFSYEYMKKLETMCEFILDITKPNGLSPIIGDADDGRLIIASNYGNWNKRDFRYILSVAGEYFNRDDFRSIGKNYKEDALWLTGKFKDICNKFQLETRAYSDGGYYILRNNWAYCMVKCGELSCKGEGGHSHNNELSIELNVDGEDFIIDPGTYVYTADYRMRNLYRSTKMHNTLYIDRYEQNNFSECDLFYMREQTFSKCKLFNDVAFEGAHYGYKQKCGVIHQRRINISGETLFIEDKLLGKKINHNVYINFILDYGVSIVEKADGIELIKNGKKIFLAFENTYSIEDAFISYGYGQKLKTKRISIKFDYNRSIISIKSV